MNDISDKILHKIPQALANGTLTKGSDFSIRKLATILGVSYLSLRIYIHSNFGDIENFYKNLGFGRRLFPSFSEAKILCKYENIKSRIEYKERCKSLNLPSCPFTVYQEWIDWYDFLEIQRPDRKPSYSEAKIICLKNGVKSQKQYKKARKNLGLPANAERSYKHKWSGWRDFLETKEKAYPTYEEAKQICRDNNITTNRGVWRNAKKLNMHSHPEKFYKEWVDWYSFFDKK